MHTRLTPDEARARFGELTVRVGKHMNVHRHFESPEGEWRPEFEEGMKLRSYRLYVVRTAPLRVPFQLKPKL